MKYAVYILAGNDKQKVKDLVKDKSTGAMIAGAAAGAVADLVGVDFYDPIAKSLGDEKSVAISGKTITGMEYNTSVVYGTRYEFTNEKKTMTDVYTTMILHTLTVKGVLEPTHAMFQIAALKELLKKKDLSRVWTWANTPFPRDPANAGDDYYRDVVAISYATEQERYRALYMNTANVGNYEEHFDKDGIGHFKLVINRMIDYTLAPADISQKPVVELVGQTFNFNATQLVKGMGTILSAGKKGLDKGIEVAEKFGYEPNDAKKFSKGMEKMIIDPANAAFNSDGEGKVDFTPTNIADQIEKGVESHRFIHNEAEKKSSTETKVETKKEGNNTIITKTIPNADGSKTVEITTKDKNNNVIKVEKKTIKA